MEETNYERRYGPLARGDYPIGGAIPFLKDGHSGTGEILWSFIALGEVRNGAAGQRLTYVVDDGGAQPLLITAPEIAETPRLHWRQLVNGMEIWLNEAGVFLHVEGETRLFPMTPLGALYILQLALRVPW